LLFYQKNTPMDDFPTANECYLKSIQNSPPKNDLFFDTITSIIKKGIESSVNQGLFGVGMTHTIHLKISILDDINKILFDYEQKLRLFLSNKLFEIKRLKLKNMSVSYPNTKDTNYYYSEGDIELDLLLDWSKR
jgi:hypothetical protein